jgi:hypothetical protein
MNHLELSLSRGEQAFLDHFNYETFNPHIGPATSWLRSHDLDWKLMSVFQRWGALHDPDFILKTDDENLLPPFEVPWSSREEFMARVKDFLILYPDLKPLVSEFLSPRVMV